MSLAVPLDVARRAAPSPAAARRTLMALAAVCLLPVAASYLAFHVWPPAGRTNAGTLLPPAPLFDSVQDMPSAIRGRWVLLTVSGVNCEPACAQARHAMRQARLSLGKEQGRVARLWLAEGESAPATSVDADGVVHLPAHRQWLARLPDSEPGAVFLMDPLGRVMMRFPARADALAQARDMGRDMQRLLKYSPLGRDGDAPREGSSMPASEARP